MHFQLSYDAKHLDVFCVGIVLFNMVLGKQPFRIAQPCDLLYRMLVSDNKKEKFWKYHYDNSVTDEKITISENLKDLIEQMLKSDP